MRERSSRSDLGRLVRGRRVEPSVVLLEGEAFDCCIGHGDCCMPERDRIQTSISGEKAVYDDCEGHSMMRGWWAKWNGEHDEEMLRIR